jgi:hypothetical protein
MPKYNVRLKVKAWVDTEVEASSKTEAIQIAQKRCSTNSLCYSKKFNWGEAKLKSAEAQT